MSTSTTHARRLHDVEGPPMPMVAMDAAEPVPAPLYDLSTLDLTKTVVTLEELQKILPQRHEFEQLHSVIHIDPVADVIVGRREVRTGEFWEHTMAGGPAALPPMLLLEYAAQLAAYWGMVRQPHMGFVGFAKCDKLGVYGQVHAPSMVYMIAKVVSIKPRRVVAQCQAICRGKVVFGVIVTGMSV